MDDSDFEKRKAILEEIGWHLDLKQYLHDSLDFLLTTKISMSLLIIYFLTWNIIGIYEEENKNIIYFSYFISLFVPITIFTGNILLNIDTILKINEILLTGFSFGCISITQFIFFRGCHGNLISASTLMIYTISIIIIIFCAGNIFKLQRKHKFPV